jgi:hypothetical protein
MLKQIASFRNYSPNEQWMEITKIDVLIHSDFKIVVLFYKIRYILYINFIACMMSIFLYRLQMQQKPVISSCFATLRFDCASVYFLMYYHSNIQRL